MLMLAVIENYIIMSLAQHHLKLILLMKGTIGSPPQSLLEPARVGDTSVSFLLFIHAMHARQQFFLLLPRLLVLALSISSLSLSSIECFSTNSDEA